MTSNNNKQRNTNLLQIVNTNVKLFSSPKYNISSLQCYSVLSDIWVKIELCIPLEPESSVMLLFAYLLSVSLNSLCFSVLSTKS